MARLPEGIFKRPNSPHYQMHFKDWMGKDYKLSTGTTKLKEAILIRNARIEAVNKGLQSVTANAASPIAPPSALGNLSPLAPGGLVVPSLIIPGASMSFEQLRNFYLSCQTNKWTLKSVNYAFDRMVAHFNNIDIFTIPPLMLKEYVDKSIVQSGPAVARQDLHYLRASMRKAQHFHLLPPGAGEFFAEIDSPDEPDPRKRFFEPEELLRILLCSPSWFQPVIDFGTLTGCRREEICNLRWEELNLKHGILHLTITKNGHRRDVRMLPMVLRMLERIHEQTYGQNPVFQNAAGGPLTPLYLDEVFLDARHRAGVADAVFHDTRRTFASWHALFGTPIGVISHYMGHIGTKSTEGYIYLTPEYFSSYINRVDPTAPPQEPPPNNFAAFYFLCTQPKYSRFLNPILFGTPNSAGSRGSGGDARPSDQKAA